MQILMADRTKRVLLGLALAGALAGVSGSAASAAMSSGVRAGAVKFAVRAQTADARPLPGAATPSNAARIQTIVDAAKSQVGRTTSYDPTYVPLAYPGGDVPIQTGVCTDVVIRAFRAIGIDLQVVVHQDMLRHFSSYPRTGLSQPDSNIDHRRVRNLATFFTRSGAAVVQSQVAADYLSGDIVMWDVGRLAHTGLVVDSLVPGTDRHLIVHNIGDGAQLEDILFAFPITGHYRYLGGSAPVAP